MIFEFLKLNIDISDDDFNTIYPKRIRKLSSQHWTPVAVAKVAADFLVERPGVKVLDIGSGAGKFCMIGAANSKGHFTGVEQRIQLIELSTKISYDYNLRNTDFIHANITSIEFREYDAFYFYNSFHENIDVLNSIDRSIKLDPELYNLYSVYLIQQFISLPIGTRIATFHSPFSIIPQTFKLQDSLYGGFLNLWEKVSW